MIARGISTAARTAVSRSTTMSVKSACCGISINRMMSSTGTKATTYSLFGNRTAPSLSSTYSPIMANNTSSCLSSISVCGIAAGGVGEGASSSSDIVASEDDR
eukprot:TRINITY_DN4083_c0_g1_i1.p1 TRINITY_DN4083_c0_g1~~TRINITY_DN4083_c0_g1_i1.p1  ORF type:complete len:103 (+),score=22.12 TRINITY_DN4083_c0_g1_i1:54-362(+)